MNKSNEPRNLSGIYFRVKTEDGFDNICFEDLTEEDQLKVMENRDVQWLQGLAMQLADVLRGIGDDLDIVSG